jgi:hypothetical protein
LPQVWIARAQGRLALQLRLADQRRRELDDGRHDSGLLEQCGVGVDVDDPPLERRHERHGWILGADPVLVLGRHADGRAIAHAPAHLVLVAAPVLLGSAEPRVLDLLDGAAVLDVVVREHERLRERGLVGVGLAQVHRHEVDRVLERVEIVAVDLEMHLALLERGIGQVHDAEVARVVLEVGVDTAEVARRVDRHADRRREREVERERVARDVLALLEHVLVVGDVLLVAGPREELREAAALLASGDLAALDGDLLLGRLRPARVGVEHQVGELGRDDVDDALHRARVDAEALRAVDHLDLDPARAHELVVDLAHLALGVAALCVGDACCSARTPRPCSR